MLRRTLLTATRPSLCARRGWATALAGAAIVVGGTWTYFLFIHNRLGKPVAKISHHVDFRDLQGPGVLVRVGVIVENKGSVLLKFRQADVRLTPMLPLCSPLKETLECRRRPNTEHSAPVGN